MARQSPIRKSEETEQPQRKDAIKVVHQSASPTQLDRLIHERIRLGIISALAGRESLSFNELKRILETTDGNLSVHARKLEEADYITCRKSFEGRMPKTEYKLTSKGREAFELYLRHMELIIRAARENQE